jgi:hypothetical protein
LSGASIDGEWDTGMDIFGSRNGQQYQPVARDSDSDDDGDGDDFIQQHVRNQKVGMYR